MLGASTEMGLSVMEMDEALLMGAAPADRAPDEFERTPAGADAFDIDGDGRCESWVMHTEAGMTVARDRDHDGVIDTFTSVGRGGHYESWEIFTAADGSARWNRTASGEVFE